MEWTLFAVDDEPYCLWEHDLAERTRDFLNGLDPEFFKHSLEAQCQTEDAKRASVGIRLSLHHATETLYSLLGAFVQAPRAPYAWIAKCSTSALCSVVRRISDEDATLLRRLPLGSVGWKQVAAAVFKTYDVEPDLKLRTVDCFARFWERLAVDFLSDVNREEYNATKHGFRTQAGGFKLEITPANLSSDSPLAKTITVGDSPHGSMFYCIKRLEVPGGRHIRSVRTCVNWSFERDVLLLQLVYVSINNVITALKVRNHVPPGRFVVLRPAQDEDFLRPWSPEYATVSMDVDQTISPADLLPLSRAEMLERLRDATRDVSQACSDDTPA